VELAAYRIVMEALANVARHARATRVRVGLRRDGDDALAVEVATTAPACRRHSWPEWG
jgi:signal transduction histidine kinase